MKDQTSIPDDIKRFVLTSIPSVPYLEALLLLRDDPTQAWDANRLAQRLYMSDKAAHALLVELHEAGALVQCDPDQFLYRYQPASEAFRHMIGRLAEAYARNLVEITNLIHSTTNKKAQKFADAFLWRKES